MNCDAPILDWNHKLRACGREANHEIGPFNLCWQHAKAVTEDVERQLGVHQLRSRIVRLETLIARRKWTLAVQRSEALQANATVYFAQMPHITSTHPLFGLIKIGYASDIETRMRELNAIPIATIPGGSATESSLHRRFAHLRREREWFEPAPDLLSYIADI